MKKYTHYVLFFSSCVLLFFSCSDGSNDVVPTGSGQGGSMARFAIVDDYLYVVDSRKLHVYEVADPAQPVKLKDIELGINIETIFPYQEKLFIGSQDGMHIYDLKDPREPVYMSIYRHITSCDPVVVQGNRAYVTLRTVNNCPRGSNQLDVVDISDPSNPQLISTYQMESPFGLGIDGSTLFVCEGENGLKVLNVEDPHNIAEISSIKDLHAFDVILRNKNLILTGKEGVFQFDYTDPENLKQQSSLTIASCE